MEESAHMLLLRLFRDIPDPRMVGKIYSSHSGRQAQKLATLIRNHWRVSAGSV